MDMDICVYVCLGATTGLFSIGGREVEVPVSCFLSLVSSM